MKYARKLTAPLSAILLILIAALAFMNLRTGTEYPPPLLDPEFSLWASDPVFGGERLFVWELEYERGIGDQIALSKALVGGKKALEIQIYQDGTDDRWTYVRLTQRVDGSRLRALLDKEIGIWVYMDSSCATKDPLSDATVCLFKVATNDGMHTLEFVFGEKVAQTHQSPTHRTILLQTPNMQWSHHPIDIVKQYRDAHWKLPDQISLSIIFGSLGSEAGWYLAGVRRITVTEKAPAETAEQSRLDIFTEDLWTSHAANQCSICSPNMHLSMQKKSAAKHSGISQEFDHLLM